MKIVAYTSSCVSVATLNADPSFLPFQTFVLFGLGLEGAAVFVPAATRN